MSSAFPLTEVGVVLTFAIIGSIVMRSLKQNQILGFILAGMILGPLGLSYLQPYEGLSQLFGELGLFVLMFYLGLELSLKKFMEAGPSAFILAFVDMLALTGAGAILVWAFGFTPLFALIVGIMIFCHSTAIVAKFVLDSKLTDNRGANIALAILILEDFLAILLIVFVTSLSASGNAASLALTAVVFAVAMFSIVRRLSVRVESFLLSHGYGHQETSLYALGIGLLVSAVAAMLGLSTTIGAYFAGFAMAETKAGNKIKHDLSFLRDFFLLFFFVSFGSTLFVEPVYDAAGALLFSVPRLPPVSDIVLLVGMAIGLAIVLISANFVVFGFIGKRVGLSNEEASLAAVLLTPLGEFLVIIATTAGPALGPRERAIISPLVFILILLSVFLFQPLYNNRHHHRKAMEFFPENPVAAKIPKSKLEQKLHSHNDATISAFQRVASNAFTVLCIAGLLFFVYDNSYGLEMPVQFSRELAFGILFVVAAAYPFFRAIKAVVMIYRHLRLGQSGQLVFAPKMRRR